MGAGLRKGQENSCLVRVQMQSSLPAVVGYRLGMCVWSVGVRACV